MALTVQFSDTSCRVQWHLLYSSVALIVQFSGTYCIVQWHLLYSSVVLTVQFSSTYCTVQRHLLYSSVALTQASLNRNKNCIISEDVIKSNVRWDVTSCKLEDRSDRRFDRISCFYLQGDRGRRAKRFITFYNTVVSTATEVQPEHFRNFAHSEPAGKIAPHISSHLNNSLFGPRLLLRSSHGDTLLLIAREARQL